MRARMLVGILGVAVGLAGCGGSVASEDAQAPVEAASVRPAVENGDDGPACSEDQLAVFSAETEVTGTAPDEQKAALEVLLARENVALLDASCGLEQLASFASAGSTYDTEMRELLGARLGKRATDNFGFEVIEPAPGTPKSSEDFAELVVNVRIPPHYLVSDDGVEFVAPSGPPLAAENPLPEPRFTPERWVYFVVRDGADAPWRIQARVGPTDHGTDELAELEATGF